MEGKTHILSAVAIYSTINTMVSHAPLIDFHNLAGTSAASFVALGAVIVGAVAPDLDIPNSYASNKMTMVNLKFVKHLMNLILAAIAGCLLYYSRNPYVLYGGIGIMGVALLNYSNLSYKLLALLRTGIQYGTAAILLYLFLRTGQKPYAYIAVILLLYVVSKHRGLSHTIILNLAAAHAVYYTLQYYGKEQYAMVAAGNFLLGSLTHVYLNDFFTNRGVPNPLYPLSIPLKLVVTALKKGRLNRHVLKESSKIDKIHFPVTFETGGFIEVVISMGSMVIIIINLLYGMRI